MDQLFNLISSSARIDKSKRKKRKASASVESSSNASTAPLASALSSSVVASRDRTGKRDTSKEKLEQVHAEKIAAFRRAMNIRIANSKHDKSISDPLTSFSEMVQPTWWSVASSASFAGTKRAVCRNIEVGKWKEPTPIQMQAIPTLIMARRDLIGAAPTGSGKSGAFLIPALILATASNESFYGHDTTPTPSSKDDKQPRNKKSSVQSKQGKNSDDSRKGSIRALALAPSLELASQLQREAERLGTGKPGGVSALLLSKSNVADLTSGTAGGKRGVDILIATPLRLVDAIQKGGLRLNTVRMVVLDEADRLLDASDGSKSGTSTTMENTNNSFLSQMDCILGEIPQTAVRCLFSATITPMVRSLSESILRDPLDLTVGGTIRSGGANPDIEQELLFVGREEGKLLAIRQIVQRGQLRPPVIVFLQSQDRAQALFAELLYDGIHVDVIHAGRSRSAREAAVAKFRKGDTWVLICTDLVARGVDFPAVHMVINYDLPGSAVTYVHRIGRTGRAGRKGKAITLFTEGDFEHLRPIANVVKQSGCDVPEWMLTMRKARRNKDGIPRKRKPIDTTPHYDKRKRFEKRQMIEQSKHARAAEAESSEPKSKSPKA